jgi:hypothetical protein
MKTGMLVIPLTKGKVAIVDASDYELLSQYKWYAMHNPNGDWYAARRESPSRKLVLMHRVILQAGPTEQVDHRNLDGLDNRRRNLRRCTPTQNRGNTPKRPNALVLYKGVTIKRPGVYMAQIQFHLIRLAEPKS